MAHTKRLLTAALLFGAAALVGVAASEPSQAGCGCTKPPPPPASVRPAVAWSGAPVTLFHSGLVAGRRYDVEFRSGVSPKSELVKVKAVSRRDLADGVSRPQLIVELPSLPLGPASIRVVRDGAVLLDLADDAFTVAPQPVGVPSGVGTYRFEQYRAAVSRDGVIYLSLDFDDVQHARTFDAQAEGWPLRFGSADLAFYNVQGFLMQLLDESMPGLFAISSPPGSDSDVLHYSRHEFNTFFLQHEEQQPHSVSHGDPNWHADGTRHVDHDNQILEIAGAMPNGALPAPGASPRFTLVVNTATLFQHGVVGEESVLVDNDSQIWSSDSLLGLPGHHGDVLSNGPVTVKNDSTVHGDATGDSFLIDGGGHVTGDLIPVDLPLAFMPVDVPNGLVPLGELEVSSSMTLGVGSYEAEKIHLTDGGVLEIANSEGPVTIYVTEEIRLDNGARIETASSDPEKFAIYLTAGASARLHDGAGFFGVVYGPGAEIRIDNGGVFAGGIVGGTVEVKNQALVFYDEALHRNVCPADPPALDLPSNMRVIPGQLLELPVSVLAALHYKVRIGGRTMPLTSLLGALGVMAPADLPAGSDIEIALVDWNGCRSWETFMVPVGPPSACGLLGIEFLLAFPLAAALRRRRS